MEPRIYISPEPFRLETGHMLPELKIAYHTYGELNAAHANVVWVCHALTANSDVAGWWPHTVETGKFLDPARHFVVCANILGSHYGTTGPLHTNPQTGTPYYRDFPPFTIRDIVRAHILLADALGIGRIGALVGSSVGGVQAVEWAVTRAAAHRQTGADRHLGQGIAVEHRHRRDAAHGHRSRPDVRRAARRRGNGRSCGGPRHRPADLQGIAGLQPHAAGPRGASGRATAPSSYQSSIRERSSADATNAYSYYAILNAIRHPRRRTRPRRGSGRPRVGSRPARSSSALRPTSSSLRPRCVNCKA